MKKIGKYSDALGVWIHKVGTIEHRITPRMGDNEFLSQLLNDPQKRKNQIQVTKAMNQFYFDLVTRDDLALTDKDKEELRAWIELNQSQIAQDIMIQYNWIKKEDIDKMANLDIEQRLKISEATNK